MPLRAEPFTMRQMNTILMPVREALERDLKELFKAFRALLLMDAVNKIRCDQIIEYIQVSRIIGLDEPADRCLALPAYQCKLPTNL